MIWSNIIFTIIKIQYKYLFFFMGFTGFSILFVDCPRIYQFEDVILIYGSHCLLIFNNEVMMIIDKIVLH